MLPSREAFVQLLIFSALLLVLLPDTRAQVYKWVDKKGTVHFTDNPDELPEPQRSKALRKIDEKLKKKKESKKKNNPPFPVRSQRLPNEQLPPDPGISGSGSTAPDLSAQRRRKKKLWQSKLFSARSKVEDLEKKCKQIQAQHHKSGRDSLIFARPGDRQASDKNAAALKECQNSLKQARRYLDIELPEQARRQKVPPGWIR